MKIIHEGKLKPLPKPWWVGIQLICEKCDTIVELEEGDNVFETMERRPGGRREAVVNCPTCKFQIHYKHPKRFIETQLKQWLEAPSHTT